MESSKIIVNGEETRIASAMDETMDFAGKAGLSAKESLRLRLMTEELLGLLAGITDNEYMAQFWVEEKGGKCILHLSGETRMTSERRAELLESATDRKNAAAVGIMGKIRDMIDVSLLSLNDVGWSGAITADQPVSAFCSAGMETSAYAMDMYVWTLRNYRENMMNREGEPLEFEEDVYTPWDELERSLIANLADDVRVSVRSDKVDIEVTKDFGFEK